MCIRDRPGHVGTTLQPFEDPDDIKQLSVDRRLYRQHGAATVVGHETRQVVDLEFYRYVTEYRACPTTRYPSESGHIGKFQPEPSGNDDAGKSYVVFGGAGVGGTGTAELSSLDGSDGFVINGINGSDFSGRSVSGAGDINAVSYTHLTLPTICSV